MKSDLHNGQDDEWLVLNHYIYVSATCALCVMHAESRRTLYKHPAWNLFLQVLHRFFGKDSSVTLIMLFENKASGPVQIGVTEDLRVTDRAFYQALEVERDVLFEETQSIRDMSILRGGQFMHRQWCMPAYLIHDDLLRPQ